MWICVFLYAVKFNSNHGIGLKTRMSLFLWPPLFLCNTKVNLNYCVGVKEKRPKKFDRNQDRDSEAKKLWHKNQLPMLCELYLGICCQCEIGTIYLPFWALTFFSLLKTKKTVFR